MKPWNLHPFTTWGWVRDGDEDGIFVLTFRLGLGVGIGVHVAVDMVGAAIGAAVVIETELDPQAIHTFARAGS